MDKQELSHEVITHIENMTMRVLEELTPLIQTSQMRYSRSDSITNLAMALLKAQGQFQKAKINTKGYGYSYANLESVLDACRPALVDNELSLIQLPTNDGNEIILTTLLVHSSGEFISSELSEMATGGKMAAVQQKGSIITYLRRYSMSAMLGISTGDDNDGNEIQEQPKKTLKKQPKHQPINTPIAPLKTPKSTPKPQKEQSPREWLSSLETVKYSDIQASLLMTGKFSNEAFAMDMIKAFPHYPVITEDGIPQRDENGNDIIFVPKSDDKVTKKSALAVFDWCLTNNGKGDSNE